MRKKIFHSFLTLTCLVLAIFTAVLVLGVYQLEQRQLAKLAAIGDGDAGLGGGGQRRRRGAAGKRWRWIAA